MQPARSGYLGTSYDVWAIGSTREKVKTFYRMRFVFLFKIIREYSQFNVLNMLRMFRGKKNIIKEKKKPELVLYQKPIRNHKKLCLLCYGNCQKEQNRTGICWVIIAIFYDTHLFIYSPTDDGAIPQSTGLCGLCWHSILDRLWLVVVVVVVGWKVRPRNVPR